MENGVERSGDHSGASRRARARDALGAVALAEAGVSEHVFVATRLPLAIETANAFGGSVTAEHGEAGALMPRFVQALEAGKRATLIAHVRDLVPMRDTLRGIVARRMGTVVHAITADGSEDAFALADLGWGVLVAAGAEESMDLALVARRAAEDCGTPFFVAHQPGHALHLEAIAPPSRELIEVFVGAPRTRLRPVADAGHVAHEAITERAFASRVTFALGSAMRELESLTGRKRDVLERVPAGEAPVVLVAVGELGESLVASALRLRSHGEEVGAIKIVALRPFPGPRLVKAMARADAVTVLEARDEPLAQSSPLAREVKSAFADAITWAPDYPGIGRVPRTTSGIVLKGLEASEMDAIVHNMMEGERGRRSFVLGEGEALPSSPKSTARASLHTLSMRGRVSDERTAEACAELCASVVSSTLGLHVRGAVRKAPPAEGEAFTFDLLASRDRPRGAHAPHAVKLVALESAAMLAGGNPLARLADEGVLALPSRERSADAVWSEVPVYAKAIVFDRRARVVGWAPFTDETDPRLRAWMVAASFAGLALANGAAKGAVDGSLVAREVSEALRVALGRGESADKAWIERGAEAARRAFEAYVEVPRAMVERDEESIRLGRRDARAMA